MLYNRYIGYSSGNNKAQSIHGNKSVRTLKNMSEYVFKRRIGQKTVWYMTIYSFD